MGQVMRQAKALELSSGAFTAESPLSSPPIPLSTDCSDQEDSKLAPFSTTHHAPLEHHIDCFKDKATIHSRHQINKYDQVLFTRSISTPRVEDIDEPGVVYFQPSSQLQYMQSASLKLPVLRDYITLPPSSTHRGRIHDPTDDDVQVVQENLAEISVSIQWTEEERDMTGSLWSIRSSSERIERNTEWISEFFARQDILESKNEKPNRRWSLERVDSLKHFTRRLSIRASKHRSLDATIREARELGENSGAEPPTSPPCAAVNDLSDHPAQRIPKSRERSWSTRVNECLVPRRHSSLPSSPRTAAVQGTTGSMTEPVQIPSTVRNLGRSKSEPGKEGELLSRLRRALSNAPKTMRMQTLRRGGKVARENI